MTGTRAVRIGLGVTVVSVFPAFLVGALAVQITEDLRFGLAGLGAAVSVFFAASAVGSAALGSLAERLGSRTAMRVAALVSAACLLAIAALVDSWAALVGLLAVGGLANALAQPSVNLLLAREVAPERQGFIFGLKQTAIPAAILVSGL